MWTRILVVYYYINIGVRSRTSWFSSIELKLRKRDFLSSLTTINSKCIMQIRSFRNNSMVLLTGQLPLKMKEVNFRLNFESIYVMYLLLAVSYLIAISKIQSCALYFHSSKPHYNFSVYHST